MGQKWTIHQLDHGSYSIGTLQFSALNSIENEILRKTQSDKGNASRRIGNWNTDSVIKRNCWPQMIRKIEKVRDKSRLSGFTDRTSKFTSLI